MRCAVVVACTNGKTTRPAVRLRDVRRSRPLRAQEDDRVFHRWVSRLDAADESRVVARDLYSGVAWSASRDAEEALGRLTSDAHMWVLSAGYGLIAVEDEVVPYAATFSPGKPDSVAQGPTDYSTVNRDWWRHLARWQPTGIRGPRTLTELAVDVDALMVAMSPRYLHAVQEDLLRAVCRGTQIVIVSGGLARSHVLAPHALDFDKRLREPEAVTGEARLIQASDMSLNPRLAEHLLEELGGDAFDLAAASAYVGDAMARRRSARSYGHRQPATDEEVAAFIHERLHVDASATKSRLLSEWRSAGRKCEQKRFGRLYDDAREALEVARSRGWQELAG